MTTSDEDARSLVICGVSVRRDFPVEIRWVMPQLAIGGMIGTFHNMRVLARAGITHVINLQEEFDDSGIVGLTGICIHWLRLGDRLEEAPIEPALKFAEDALRCAQHSLFIHCMAGRNRSPKIAYLVLRWRGATDAEARNWIKTAEPYALLEEDVLLTLLDRTQRFRD